jgi:hypothetical protein
LGGDLLLTPVAGKARRILFAATEERSRETSALVRMVASAVAGSGSRVLLIDDGGRSSGSAKCSLASVLRGDASLREAVIALPGPGSLHLLSGDHGTASMDPFLRQAEANYDCILVVAQGAPDRTRHEAILAWAHVGVLLVWRGRSKSRDLLQARNLFHEFSTGLTGFIRMV